MSSRPIVASADVPLPSGGSDRNAIPLYDFSNVKVVKHYIAEGPLRTSALRALGGYANVFSLESFVDELAALAGTDPVEFRLRHLKDARARAVIEAAAQRGGWAPDAKGDGGRGRGFAFARYKNLACYCAIAADVDGHFGRLLILAEDQAVGQILQVAESLALPADQSAGVIGFGMPPTSASRATSLGSFSASPTALLRMSTISCGVPFGAEIP